MRLPEQHHVDALRETLEHITANEQIHNQAVWAVVVPANWMAYYSQGVAITGTDCGVACCLAGDRAYLDGNLDRKIAAAVTKIQSGGDGIADLESTDDGQDIREYAADRFGLEFLGERADVLFNPTNALWQLWTIAAILTEDNDHPIPPSDNDEEFEELVRQKLEGAETVSCRTCGEEFIGNPHDAESETAPYDAYGNIYCGCQGEVI